MNDLEPADQHCLNAAQGWLDLGNHVEANEELERIEAKNRAHPNVLQVRWRIYAKAEKWDACLEIARTLTNMTPDRRFGWVHLAMTLRKLDRCTEAKAVLLSVLDRFEANTTFPYYLACYCASLGQTSEAKGWLERAFAQATGNEERKRLKLRALQDPDLEPLWRDIGQR